MNTDLYIDLFHNSEDIESIICEMSTDILHEKNSEVKKYECFIEGQKIKAITDL